MKEKGIELFFKAGNTLVDKLNSLNEPSELGKCIRTVIRVTGAGFITYVICKNGGINYKNKLFIGTTEKEKLA